MELKYFKDPVSLVRRVMITFSEYDLLAAYQNMDSIDRYCMDEWSRDNSSIEEKFMALQLIARKLKVAA